MGKHRDLPMNILPTRLTELNNYLPLFPILEDYNNM